MIFVLVGIYFYQYLGLPLLYFRMDPLRANDVTDSNLIFLVFLYTSATITLMVFGFIAGRKVCGKCAYIESEKLVAYGVNSIMPILYLTLICIAVLILYIRQIGYENIAFIAALNLVPENSIALMRSNMGNSFEGKYHWYYLFMNQILKFCVLTFFANLLLAPRKRNTIFFVFSFIFLTVSLVMATEKGPLANLLISLFLVYVIVKNKAIVPLKNILLLASSLIAILIIFYINFMGATSVSDAFLGVFSRSLTGQIQPAYHYLQFFPNHQEFLMGRSFTNPMGIFPFKSYNISQEVMAWYDSNQTTSGIVGSMPTIYWGELYANFGIAGVLSLPFFVGFFLYWFNNKLLMLFPTPLLVGLLVWFMMYFYNLNGTSLTSFIFDIYSFFVLVSFFVLTLIITKGKLILNKLNLNKYRIDIQSN